MEELVDHLAMRHQRKAVSRINLPPFQSCFYARRCLGRHNVMANRHGPSHVPDRPRWFQRRARAFGGPIS